MLRPGEVHTIKAIPEGAGITMALQCESCQRLAEEIARLRQELDEARSTTGLQIETALREEVQRRRVLIEQSRDGIVTLSPTGRVYEANQRFADMLGYTAEEILELHVWDWDAQWNQAELIEKLRTVDQSGDHFETRHRRKDGSCYDVEISSSGTTWAGEKLVLCVCRDISRRKRMEEALRESEQRLKLALIASRMRVWDWDIATNTVCWSSETTATFGIENKSATPEFFTNMLHPEDAPRVTAAVEAALASHDVLEVEFRISVTTGEVRWLSCLGQARYDDQGRPVRMVGTASDVTERKQAEQTRQQLEKQLLHAQKLESIGVLAGGIAHDFNNILAGIRAYAELVLSGLPADGPAREYAEEILAATQRAAHLTRQILAYAGKGQFQSEPVNLSQVVEGLKKMLEVAVSKKAVLTYDLSTDLPYALADAGQIQQVVMNLVVNASDALDDNCGQVSIATRAVRAEPGRPLDSLFGGALPDGLYATLEVSDTGCGMDALTLEKIFDPFFSTKFAGRGLGLAMVEGIVRAHRGGFQVSSEPGAGATFRVLLPATDHVPAVAAFPAAEAESTGGGGTVLVVDDEQIVRESTAARFQAAGFDVLTAGDGQEAIEVFRRRHGEIVCVILDLAMPRMSGDEVFRELRRIAPDARVVLTTGYLEDEVAHRLAEEGLFGFVQKPEPLAGIIDRLQAALARSDRRNSG